MAAMRPRIILSLPEGLPAGSGVHHYHMQVFALDAPLDIAADADRAALVGAMRGHVLGKARLVGTYAAPAE